MCFIVYDVLNNFSVEKPRSSPNDPDYVPSLFFFSNNTTAVNRQNKSRWKQLANRCRKSNQLRETRVSSKHGEIVSEGTLDEGEVIAENADVEDDNNADVEDENADVEDECTGSQGSISQFISHGEIVDTTAVRDGSSISTKTPLV